MLYGALPRIVATADWRHSLLMALGLAILANSRPYEGLVVSLPVAAALVAWLLADVRARLAPFCWSIALPTAFVLSATAVLMGYYNYRVTGDPAR